jgi:DNA polymerase III subunit gamma/tau
VLATTDPQKIPVTVLSRCLQFNLKQMAPASIRGHLERILGEEGIAAEAPALALVAQSARGSMRDALSLLDQAIAYAGGRVTESEVRAMLGSVDRDYVFRLIECVAAGDVPGVVAIADEMAARSLSYSVALQDLAATLYRMALAAAAPDALPLDSPDRDRVLAQAAQLAPETIQLNYQIAVIGRDELRLAPDEYSGFVMTLLRMVAFQPAASGESAPRVRSPLSAPARVAPVAPPRAAARPVVAAAPAIEGSRASVGGGASAALVRAEPVASPAAPAAMSDHGEPWIELVRTLKLSGFARQLADRSTLVSREGNRFVLALPPTARQLAEYREKLAAGLTERLGTKATVEVSIGEVQGPTVAGELAAQRDAARAAAQSTMKSDAFVTALVNEMGATIESVEPLSNQQGETG